MVSKNLVERNGKKMQNSANRVLHLYKMRFSQVEQGIKIYFNLDLNTGRTKDCFVTSKFDSPIQLTKTRLVYAK